MLFRQLFLARGNIYAVVLSRKKKNQKPFLIVVPGRVDDTGRYESVGEYARDTRRPPLVVVGGGGGGGAAPERAEWENARVGDGRRITRRIRFSASDANLLSAAADDF